MSILVNESRNQTTCIFADEVHIRFIQELHQHCISCVRFVFATFQTTVLVEILAELDVRSKTSIRFCIIEISTPITGKYIDIDHEITDEGSVSHEFRNIAFSIPFLCSDIVS